MKLLLLSFILFSNVINAKDCTVQYDSSSTQFGWKAFKFTEKTGVVGTFDTIQVDEKISAKSVVDLANKIKFTIPIDSVNTKNPDRDAKIKKFFFGTMKATKEISGSFKNTKLDKDSGTSDLTIKMNGMEKTIPVKFTLKEGKNLELKTMIDLLNWDAKSSVDALNKECNALHIGKDGISKLWSEVEFTILTTFKSVCK